MRQWRTIGASQPVQGSTYCSVGMIIAQAVWRETRSRTSVKWRRILKTCVVAFSITQSAFPVSWTNFASLNEIRRKGRLIVTKPWVTGFSAQEHLLRSRKRPRSPPLKGCRCLSDSVKKNAVGALPIKNLTVPPNVIVARSRVSI